MDTGLLINASLHRTIKDGKEYEKLIPLADSINTSLKQGDTHETLRLMAQWAKTYGYQMAKVAPLLKGKTLAQTVHNIYEFLYWHFQYNIDGDEQNLFSPARAWKERYKGIDCKSYSILASTILQNLGIEHAFRKVKQPHLMPENFTHVYVIVPTVDKQYYVIDATTHNNKEVKFTEKHDFNMKLRHTGLSSPYTKFTGISCPGGSCSCNKGMGSPSINQAMQAIDSFHVWLDDLEAKGVSKQTTATIAREVKASLDRGIDPNMGDVIAKVSVPSGLHSGLGFDFNSLVPKGGASGGTGVANSLLTIGATAALGPAGPIVASIIPTELVGNTFGAVFSNGLNLSCWGSSMNPEEGKRQIEQPGGWREQSVKGIAAISQAKSLEELSMHLTNENKYYRQRAGARMYHYNRVVDCSKKGHKVVIDFLNGIGQQIDDIADSLKATMNVSVQVINDTTMEEGAKEPQPYTYKKYVVTPLAQQAPQQQIVQQGASQSAQFLAPPSVPTTANATATLPAAAAPASNTTTMVVVGAALVGAMFLIVPRLK